MCNPEPRDLAHDCQTEFAALLGADGALSLTRIDATCRNWMRMEIVGWIEYVGGNIVLTDEGRAVAERVCEASGA